MYPIPQDLTNKINELTPLQLAWLSGYCWAQAQESPPPLTIISASQSGNARRLAEQLTEQLRRRGLQPRHWAAADYPPEQLGREKILLLITATAGEGEPPEEAQRLYRALWAREAPDLSGLRFAVCGLGDRSYPNFCQAGKNFAARLLELGARQLLPRQDFDVDYASQAPQWFAAVSAQLTGAPQEEAAAAPLDLPPAAIDSAAGTADGHDRDNPLAAPLLRRQRLSGPRSLKEVYQLEFDLSGGDFNYEPGDSLGLWLDNDPQLVAEILAAVGLSGDERVTVAGQAMDLRRALGSHLEISRNNPYFLDGYGALANNKTLTKLIDKDRAYLAEYNPIVAIVKRFPCQLTAEQLTGLLQSLQPRYYSIASAREVAGDRATLTVNVLNYELDGSTRFGACSSYLGQRLREGEPARLFLQANPNFRLPRDPATDIIMIGCGTGIAPYRAFMQLRRRRQAPGRHWLIFGNQFATEDFLYGDEWQSYAAEGYLQRQSLAWSRDQPEKIYVQDKIREEAEEFWRWLAGGAHVYVCGEAAKLGRSVEKALLEVIQSQGQRDEAAALDYLDQLRREKRYQRDVY